MKIITLLLFIIASTFVKAQSKKPFEFNPNESISYKPIFLPNDINKENTSDVFIYNGITYDQNDFKTLLKKKKFKDFSIIITGVKDSLIKYNVSNKKYIRITRIID